MMNYDFYLPIEINNRRWHMCHLKQDGNNDDSIAKFSFIIDKNSNTLFEIPCNAKFVCSGGYDYDIQIETFRLKNYRIVYENDCYYVDFIKENNTGISEKVCDGISISKNVNRINNPLTVKVDPDKIQKHTFNIGIRLIDKLIYSYVFQIHLCNKHSNNYTEAAIDFGSEASQVSYKRGTDNKDIQIPLISYFKKFYPDYFDIEEFWQGREYDLFFKSIFFVYTGTREKGIAFQYDDPPFRYNEESFIQVLKPKIGAPRDYLNLYTLPNLKIVECIANRQDQAIPVYLSEERPFELTSNEASIYQEDIIKSSLRIILNHIIYAILKQIVSTRIPDQFLHITLLMPNVYPQHKVYTLITNLYKDFYEIIKQESYSSIKGIEIQMISESDAAFLGAKRNRAREWKIPNRTNAHYLIIDSGKGTTDFSILKQCKNHTNFDSIYRTGIPASGHVLTYAFFEALEDFLKQQGNLLLHNLVKTASRTAILDFMEKLEYMKQNYNDYNEMSNEEVENIDNNIFSSIKSLDDVNTFLENNFAQKLIPSTRVKVNNKIEKLLKAIREEIDKSGVNQFENVVFTGRGFRFAPFRKKTEEMLISANKIDTATKIVYKDDNSTKTICMDGAFVVNHSRINQNSELIGLPLIEVDDKNEMRRMKAWSLDNTVNNFFVNGIRINRKFKNFTIRLGGRSSHILNNDTKSDCFFYFVGNGFITQYKDKEAESFDETYETQNEIDTFVRQSLFPFYDLNINYSRKSDSNKASSFSTESYITSKSNDELPNNTHKTIKILSD